MTIVTEKRGFVNGTWSLPSSNGLTVPYARAEGWNQDSSVVWGEGCSIPSYIHHVERTLHEAAAAIPVGLFDYVWINNLQDGPPDLGPGFRLIAETDRTALFVILPKG